jgi:hypothetical protein
MLTPLLDLVYTKGPPDYREYKTGGARLERIFSRESHGAEHERRNNREEANRAPPPQVHGPPPPAGKSRLGVQDPFTTRNEDRIYVLQFGYEKTVR